MSSLAGVRGFPSAPAYSASKGTARLWAEGLRGRFAEEGVEIAAILPGFVESRITAANDFPMPLMLTGERAAKIIRRGLQRNKARIAFPRPLALAAAVVGLLPSRLVEAVARRLPRKETH